MAPQDEGSTTCAWNARTVREAVEVAWSRRRGRPLVASVDVGELTPLRGGPAGATLLGCGLCGRCLSGMGGPSRESLVCEVCAVALADAGHPLGALLREAWRDALRVACGPPT